MTQFALTKLAARPPPPCFSPSLCRLPVSFSASAPSAGPFPTSLSPFSATSARTAASIATAASDYRWTPGFSDQLSFVARGKAAPSIQRDDSWDTTLAWAFLAWRPNNDLLLRLGKVRVPIT